MNNLHEIEPLKVTWKPPILDELISSGQRKSAPAISSIYYGKWKQLARAVASVLPQKAHLSDS